MPPLWASSIASSKGAVWSKIAFDQSFLDAHSSIDHGSVGNQAHAADHGVELHQSVHIVRLMGHGVSEHTGGLGDEVAVKRLQLGLFGFAMRVDNLRPLRQP